MSFSQSYEFEDETEFLDALNGLTPFHETYEECPTLDYFEIINGNPSCNINCSNGDGKTYYMGNQKILTMSFSQPVNAFGTFYNGAGSAEEITVTFRTENNESYIIFMTPGNLPICNKQFKGVISNMVFESVTFEWTDENDEIFLEDTYMAFVPVVTIPTLSHWGIIILSLLLIIFTVVTLSKENSKSCYNTL
jgi:hypothetical protein